jgi:retron-type reverse transcriptase
VSSPLLANIALDGLEERLKAYAESQRRKNKRGDKWLGPKARRDLLGYIRYADDLVVLHDEASVVEKCKCITEQFLTEMGLELKPEKNRYQTYPEPNGGRPTRVQLPRIHGKAVPRRKISNRQGCERKSAGI